LLIVDGQCLVVRCFVVIIRCFWRMTEIDDLCQPRMLTQRSFPKTHQLVVVVVTV
jgi:hypothetical protein